MRGLAFPGEEPYRQELISYINVILGHHGKRMRLLSPMAFWFSSCRLRIDERTGAEESHDYWTKLFDGTERVGDDDAHLQG
jgi:hypothetical protein